MSTGKQIESVAVPIRSIYSDSRNRYGLVIPEYQRNYAWESDQINRFYFDIINGLSLNKTSNSITFLGAIVICDTGKRKIENEFTGDSCEIVDGQQRMTTCVLFAIKAILHLREKIQLVKSDISINKTARDWLEKEVSECCNNLTNLLHGWHGESYSPMMFPRIIREEDIRSKITANESYTSPISKLIKAFSKKDEEILNSKKPNFEFDIEKACGTSDEGNRYKKTLTKFEGFLLNLSNKEFHKNNDVSFIETKDLNNAHLNNVWESQTGERSYIIRECAKNSELEKLYRLCLLSWYYLKECWLSIIVTRSELSAFDIFDTLNTTGVPLSSVQTLKPRIIKYHREINRGWQSSEAKKKFDTLEEILKAENKDNSYQQTESKKIVVSAALLLNGQKLGEALSLQRQYLQNALDECQKNSANIELIPEVLEKIATYRNKFHRSTETLAIDSYLKKVSTQDIELLKICNAMLSRSYTHLSVSILTKFWWDGTENGDHTIYLEACKALIAFFILRRAATVGTETIPELLRSLMKGSSSGKPYTGLKLGFKNRTDSNLNDFKIALIEGLNTRPFKFDLTNKVEWVKRVCELDLFGNSKPILRFMLHLAHHQTEEDTTSGCEGLVKRVSTLTIARDFLKFDLWMREEYGEIEHVAPESGNASLGYKNVYDDGRTKNTLGNFVLIPKWANGSIQNSAWDVKKLFCKVANETDEIKRQTIVDNASNHHSNPIQLPKKARENLLNNKKNAGEMILGIHKVPDWDASFIEKRSKRLAENVWDTIVPWLS